MKTNIKLMMLIAASTLLFSCQKENAETSSTGKNYEIKVTVEGQTYQYSYEKSGCDIAPAFCGLQTGAGFAEYRNNLLGSNQIWFGTGYFGGLQAIIVENCTDNCIYCTISLKNWAVGTYNDGMLSLLINGDLYLSDPATSQPDKPVTVRITQSGNIGSIIKANFSGTIYKKDFSSNDYIPVTISGEFSAGRFN